MFFTAEGGKMFLELLKPFMADNKYIKPDPPATAEMILSAEKSMGVDFPDELKALLSEFDGDRYLCFSCNKIVETNQSVREGLSECYEGLCDLLFIAGNGCGDYYGYRSENKVCMPGSIIIWEHETNETHEVARSLAEMIGLYYTDRI